MEVTSDGRRYTDLVPKAHDPYVFLAPVQMSQVALSDKLLVEFKVLYLPVNTCASVVSPFAFSHFTKWNRLKNMPRSMFN